MNKAGKSIILIVDDKAANILALENLLAGDQLLLLTAQSGKEALKITLDQEVDLIILDVQMPDMDGFEVAQILKSKKKTQDIPIIFATAESKERKLMMKGYSEGAIDYLFKPLDPEVVKAKVNVLLKIQLQKKELSEKNLSLEKSALLINNSADIIGIMDAVSFSIEEINNAFTNVLGYSLDEVKGKNLEIFIVEEDRSILRKAAEDSTSSQLSFDIRLRSKEGAIKWLSWKVVVKEGKWYVNARDITDIKEAERIRNYLATVVKQSSDAIYIHDEAGRIISWNEGAEKIYGYRENEALKMNIFDIVPDHLRDEMKDVIGTVIQGEKIQGLGSKRVTREGKLIDVLFSASVIIESPDEQKSIAITERDVTDQKIADEKIQSLNEDLHIKLLQLEETNKELGSFSYSVSHDLRAPLRALNGYSQMIEENYSPVLDEEAKRLLTNIRNNAQRMGVLIDDLLAFSRLGRKEIQKSFLDVHRMVETVVMEVGKATPHHAEITIQDLPPAEADFTLFHQVWVNLLLNAVKYSGKKEKPVIEIGSEVSQTETIYFIRDNGAGFDMKYSDKLFGVFQRLHGPKEFEGTGVGLAIVHRIITKHGGRVWADAKPDEGATFYFSIPKIKTPDPVYARTV
jgi:PAS domain S-box-containing protein